jgi:hypothetical protein
MASVRPVQYQIRRLDGFRVVGRYANGRDIRNDRERIGGYNHFVNSVSGALTVADWKRLRFYKPYQGFQCDVLYESGEQASGQTRLATLRASYASGRT